MFSVTSVTEANGVSLNPVKVVHKLKSILMLVVLGISVLVGVFSVPSVSQAMAAQSPTAVHYGWNGYDGNETVYMTSYLTSTWPYVLPSYDSTATEAANHQLPGENGWHMEFPRSGVALTFGGTVKTNPTTFHSSYYYYPTDQVMLLLLL